MLDMKLKYMAVVTMIVFGISHYAVSYINLK